VPWSHGLENAHCNRIFEAEENWLRTTIAGASNMNWSKYTFRQSEIGTFLQRQDLPMVMREFLRTNDLLHGVPTLEWVVREFMVNEDGEWIEPWGSTLAGWRNFFRYWHEDISIQFLAWRPRGRGHNWVDYDPANNRSRANCALGPVCTVLIDDRLRRLSPEEKKAVQENITNFLLGSFRQSRMAISPYPESVLFDLVGWRGTL
jgi:hypothetical protein